eukprot:1150852-Pelagomonas_calceolata.AAC.10
MNNQQLPRVLDIRTLVNARGPEVRKSPECWHLLPKREHTDGCMPSTLNRCQRCCMAFKISRVMMGLGHQRCLATSGGGCNNLIFQPRQLLSAVLVHVILQTSYHADQIVYVVCARGLN